ncbi:MAG TPA: hypothetical protein VKW06_00625 [Candidatus Angelobacter sp.]|nr:hypothetical protein [Candidatus Angelobacter sp.]
MKRREDEQNHQRFCSAIVASTIASAWTGKSHPPSDFMPEQRPRSPQRMTPEQQLEAIKKLHKAFGGDMKDFEHRNMN